MKNNDTLKQLADDMKISPSRAILLGWDNHPIEPRKTAVILSDFEFDVIRDLRQRRFGPEIRFSAMMRRLVFTGIAVHLRQEEMAVEELPKILLRPFNFVKAGGAE